MCDSVRAYVCVFVVSVSVCVCVVGKTKRKLNVPCAKSFLDGTHYTKGLRRKTVLSDSENWAEARKASQAGQPSAREQSSELKVAIRERMSKRERERERE